MALYKALEKPASGKIAFKMHWCEPGNGRTYRKVVAEPINLFMRKQWDWAVNIMN